MATDLQNLTTINHSCTSDYVWQIDIQQGEGQYGISFREIRLPHSITVHYPRAVSSLAEEWNRRAGVLVASVDSSPVGYIRLNDKIITQTAWVTDLVVSPSHRRNGIASSLLLAGQAWALDRNNERMMLEMSSKNHPAIALAQKLSFEFSGYNDNYYNNKDIALFFGKNLQ